MQLTVKHQTLFFQLSEETDSLFQITLLQKSNLCIASPKARGQEECAPAVTVLRDLLRETLADGKECSTEQISQPCCCLVLWSLGSFLLLEAHDSSQVPIAAISFVSGAQNGTQAFC
jgi:hypothetical protein